MPPPTETLLKRLASESSAERLEAARYFALHAVETHEGSLREALAKESIPWIKGALRRALSRISHDAGQFATSNVDQDDAPEGFTAQVFAEALETTTAQLVHEIEPILGTLRLSAELEVPNFEHSQTRKSVDRLDDFLAALSRLRQAASAPETDEFQLDELVQECISATNTPDGLVIQKAGPQHCVVSGDRKLVQLCFQNGLRNAIDATLEKGGRFDEQPITVNWGVTERDTWVSIIDLGIGFQGSVSRAFQIGTSTKAGHLGMGLAIASQALASMGGTVVLVPNERGVRFELRWPTGSS